MTDLTEKWKNGELPDGRYYIKINDDVFIARLSFDTFFIENSPWKNCVKEVLAPVPSYAEYMILVSYKEELTKACKMRDKIIKKYQDIDTWWEAENQKLFNLLKECRERLGDYAEFCIKEGFLNAEDEAVKTITKIDEVLK